MTFSNSYACGLQPPAVLWNNSQLKNLTFKNLALYPSDFTTEASQGATLNWANLNFQPIGEPNERVWQLQGSGYTNQKSVDITYTTATPYNIGFEGPVSGTITSSSVPNALNAYQVASVESSTGGSQTVIRLTLTSDQPLLNFGYSVLIKDNKCPSGSISGDDGSVCKGIVG